jgi:hypothetical protein
MLLIQIRSWSAKDGEEGMGETEQVPLQTVTGAEKYCANESQ